MIDIIASLDFETTGVDPHTDRPVSVNFALIDGQGRRLPGSIHTLVAATGEAGEPVTIPEEASAVHGITTEHARRYGVPADVVALHLAAMMDIIARDRIPLCIFNATFDWTMLHVEGLRCGIVMPSDVLLLDPLVIDRDIDRYRKGKRTLTAMSQHYGVALDTAHDAEADAAAAVAIVRKQLTHPELTPLSLRALQFFQHGAFINWREHMNEYWARIGKDARVTESWPGHLSALDFPPHDEDFRTNTSP